MVLFIFQRIILASGLSICFEGSGESIDANKDRLQFKLEMKVAWTRGGVVVGLWIYFGGGTD